MYIYMYIYIYIYRYSMFAQAVGRPKFGLPGRIGNPLTTHGLFRGLMKGTKNGEAFGEIQTETPKISSTSENLTFFWRSMSFPWRLAGIWERRLNGIGSNESWISASLKRRWSTHSLVSSIFSSSEVISLSDIKSLKIDVKDWCKFSHSGGKVLGFLIVCRTDGQNMGQLLVTYEKISTEHIEVEDRWCYVLLEIFQ